MQITVKYKFQVGIGSAGYTWKALQRKIMLLDIVLYYFAAYTPSSTFYLWGSAPTIIPRLEAATESWPSVHVFQIFH